MLKDQVFWALYIAVWYMTRKLQLDCSSTCYVEIIKRLSAFANLPLQMGSGKVQFYSLDSFLGCILLSKSN